MVRGKEFRRGHYKRKKARIRNMLVHNYGRDPDSISPTEVGILANTPKLCSSWCCGNPRKWFGQPTIQEMRKIEATEQHESRPDLGK